LMQHSAGNRRIQSNKSLIVQGNYGGSGGML
jgi:hypothetical protein